MSYYCANNLLNMVIQPISKIFKNIQSFQYRGFPCKDPKNQSFVNPNMEHHMDFLYTDWPVLMLTNAKIRKLTRFLLKKSRINPFNVAW